MQLHGGVTHKQRAANAVHSPTFSLSVQHFTVLYVIQNKQRFCLTVEFRTNITVDIQTNMINNTIPNYTIRFISMPALLDRWSVTEGRKQCRPHLRVNLQSRPGKSGRGQTVLIGVSLAFSFMYSEHLPQRRRDHP